jgi:hypothetical protein
METFTLRLPWWPILRLFSRNPLVRRVDRIEAAVVLLVTVAALLGAPIAAVAVGTAVHDARSDPSTERAPTRHPVTAALTDIHAIGAGLAPPDRVFNMPARWPLSGGERRGALNAAPTIQLGGRASIWVDNDGQQVDEPTAPPRGAHDPVLAALVIWVIVITAAAGLFALTRAMTDHVRNTGWQHDINNLLCRGGGHTNSQPWRPRRRTRSGPLDDRHRRDR